jgi:hypothetical protein
MQQATFIDRNDPQHAQVLGQLAAVDRSSNYLAGTMNISAAAFPANDALVPGAIEVPKFETLVVDLLRRSSPTLMRFSHIPATGIIHRYFEQTAYSTGAFTTPTALTPAVSNPTRVERGAYVKAIVNQTNITHFDMEAGRQQGQFEYIAAQDITDIINGILKVSATATWAGTDTSLTSPTTNQYVGLLTQITLQATIAPGASIVDGLKRQVASMVGNLTFSPKPTAIYANPLLLDYIDAEAKAQQVTFGSETTVAGITVKTLRTQAGDLPLIPDAYMPTSAGSAYGFPAPPANNQNYYAVIVTEAMVRYAYIASDGDPKPRIFQLGLVANLAGQYVGVLYDTIYAAGATYAHAVVAVQRP